MILMTLLAVWFSVAFVFCLALGCAAAKAAPSPVQDVSERTSARPEAERIVAEAPEVGWSCAVS